MTDHSRLPRSRSTMRFGQAHRALQADVPESVMVELGRLARQTSRSVAGLVRDALTEYLARHGGEQ